MNRTLSARCKFRLSLHHSGKFVRYWPHGLAHLPVVCAMAMYAGQVGALDISGPAGSVHFGTSVTVLPDGNIVVTDPDADSNTHTGVGAVYLYAPSGGLISTITGSSTDDHVGSGGVLTLANGNYVIVSTQWRGNAAVNAGAVTWGSAVTGVSGVVSASNSLVGTSGGDQVGSVTRLSNGNYVVSSPSWDNNGIVDAGAVTWCDGNGGTKGAVSASNSLVGSSTGDGVGNGNVYALNNGNYVVGSPFWDDGATTDVGAATWGNGNGGTVGAVSASNSLVGTTSGDSVGSGVGALSNGNYVVMSQSWSNGGTLYTGAVTWGDGNGGTVGAVSASNSLVGTTEDDEVGGAGLATLTNGNYAVISVRWSNLTGAVTWGNGNGGTVGEVSSSNSLVGSSAGDRVGGNGVVGLTNGDYVVGSPGWSSNLGAATWGNGNGGTVGAVSIANSLVGKSAGDRVGYGGVFALTNGNYVVSSPFWDADTVVDAGAVTWGDGNGGTVGTVSASNSLVGSTDGDSVGYGGGDVRALSNGNYVLSSPFWDDAVADVGAVTWANGNGGSVGTVSAGNSLIGSSATDNVGYGSVFALSSGDYVVSSPYWDDASTADVGAVTWGSGNGATVGTVSAANSLVGSSVVDNVSDGDVTALSDGDYVVSSPDWDNGSIVDAGAITLRRGSEHAGTAITAENSVRGGVASGGSSLVFDYDAKRGQLVVGRPAENIVTLFKADLLFRNGFD